MMKILFLYLRYFFCGVFLLLILSSCKTEGDQLRWWRGNMHTHTFWSDGDNFPENVAKWYKDNDYDFLVFTDHNILHKLPVTGTIRDCNVLVDGELWRRLPEDHPAFHKYNRYFGKEWVGDTRPDEEEGYLQVRLKTFDEYRGLFEEPDKFMLMMGNEISDQHAVHLFGYHHEELVPTVGGSEDDRPDMIREIVKRVDEYRERTGRNTYPVLAHPNFRWAITAEMILEAKNLSFFEVYNGHPAVNNEGDKFRASTERMWDIVLSKRLGKKNGNLLYGMATDDAHRYHCGPIRYSRSSPGRGWVMVRSSELKDESILNAIDRGDFYSSTGVVLSGLEYDGEKIRVDIEPEEGVTYTTEYIGTLSGFDASSRPTLDGEGNEIPNTTRTYSEEIGKVLARTNDMSSNYTLTGDELYVRVKITSSADQIDQITGEVIGKQVAWIQPVLPADALDSQN